MDDRKMDTGQFVSLKEMFGLHLQPLKEEITELKQSIDKLSSRQVSLDNYDNLRLQVASLSEGLREVEKRVVALENYHRVGMWAFRIFVTVGTALIIGYLSGLLN